jgi:hypothetical protein
MRMRWLLLAASACRTPSLPPPTPHPPPPASTAAPRPAPVAPPTPEAVDDCEPAVRDGRVAVVITNHFAELPAVTDDGKLVAIVAQSDRELAVELLDATRDVRVGRVVVVDRTRLDEPGLHDRVLRARLLFADRRLVPLVRYRVDGADARGEGAAFSYREPILSVGPSLKQAVPHWSATEHTAADGSVCPAPSASLAEAYGRADLATFLAVIAYARATGSCPQPAPSYHAFRGAK